MTIYYIHYTIYYIYTTSLFYVGSDDVFLCNDYSEAKIAFGRINGNRNGVGLINDGALVQVCALFS